MVLQCGAFSLNAPFCRQGWFNTQHVGEHPCTLEEEKSLQDKMQRCMYS
jgi:hypothetical protein